MTGFDDRNAGHARHLDQAVSWLRAQGFHRVEPLEASEHRPDFLVEGNFYVDLKTRQPKHRGTGNFAVEAASMTPKDRPVWFLYIDQASCEVVGFEPREEAWSVRLDRLPRSGGGSTDLFYRVPVDSRFQGRSAEQMNLLKEVS